MTEQTVKDCLRLAVRQLQTAGHDNPQLEADLLMAFTLEKDRSWLFAWPEYVLQKDDLQTFHLLLDKRLDGQPISYLTGEREFWGLRLKVSPATLIPRPETELLVETALKLITKPHARVIDLGTGSGAIAIALASERPDWTISAADIDEDTLQIARENCQRHAPGIQLLHSHWLDQITDKGFDLIISNPPYIADNDPHLQRGDLRFEPSQALASGADGLNDIRQICRRAGKHLNANGWLMLEHGYNQANQVFDLLNHNSFFQTQTLPDLNNQPRITIGCRCKSE